MRNIPPYNMETTMLKSSWELENELSKMELSNELKTEIESFISKNKVIGIPQSYGNLYYRSNLQYILETISDPELLIELTEFNKLIK